MDSKDPDKLKLSGKTGDTARIDRRNTILAQLEAALMADKLALEEAASSGSDPYNSGVYKAVSGVWDTKRPR
jgi:hypothetical protein